MGNYTSKLTALILGLATLLFFGKSWAEQAHFHHVRLNVQDRDATAEFYQTVFGATPVNFNNRTPGLFTERSFILMNQVDDRAFTNLKTAIWHIGWGGVDGPSEYQWWLKQGVEFYTPLTELGRNHYMYLFGPDKEVVEIYTGNKNHRFNHVHILASDPLATVKWLQDTLDLKDENVRTGTDRGFVDIDNVQIIVYPNSDRYRPKEQGETVVKTDDSAISHIAFSFRDLEAAYQELSNKKVVLESSIKMDSLHGLPSFFARAPDGVKIEFVQAKPLPEGIWE